METITLGKSTIDIMIGEKKIKFLITERKPDGIPDTNREEEISFTLDKPIPFFPEEPDDYIETAIFYMMYYAPGALCIGFNFRRWQEKCSGLEECLNGPYLIPDELHPSREELMGAEKVNGIAVLRKVLY